MDQYAGRARLNYLLCLLYRSLYFVTRLTVTNIHLTRFHEIFVILYLTIKEGNLDVKRNINDSVFALGFH